MKRIATKRIHQKFERSLTLMSEVNDEAYRLKILIDIYGFQAKFAADTKTVIPYVPTETALYLIRNAEKMKRSLRAVQDRKLGIKEGENGDFDIVAPGGMTKEQVEGLLGWILPLIGLVGFVVLAGVIYKLVETKRELAKQNAKYNALVATTDYIFCLNPNSEKCSRYKELKIEHEIDQRKGLADKIGEFIAEGTSALKKGGALGIGLAIPVLVAAYLYSTRSK